MSTHARRNNVMKPKMRALQITPFSRNDGDYLHLHDPLGFASDAAVAVELAQLLSLFDGLHSPAQIIASYRALGGEELPLAFIEKTIADLDENLMLDSPRLVEKMNAFDRLPTRPAALAGMSYPDDARELGTLLDGFFAQAQKLKQPHMSTHAAGKTPRGIVVPHIDFTRGGPVEALAYDALGSEHFDVLVVLGIAHNGVRYPFCATEKDYETPLGICATDKEFVQELQSRVGERLTREQIAHKNEHSIEFVAVFLQHLEHLKNTRIVPILCGGFHNEARSGDSPENNPDIAQFIGALREIVRQRESQGQRVGLIASVDGAHVGSRFGDDEPLTPQRLQKIEQADREWIRCIEEGDAEGLHVHFARDNNARNVDAYPALYTLMKAFPDLRGQFLHYAQAFDEPANSLVSFASMSLFR